MNNIKLFLSDADGVLTDGGMYISCIEPLTAVGNAACPADAMEAVK
jgi:hypothetical protein